MPKTFAEDFHPERTLLYVITTQIHDYYMTMYYNVCRIDYYPHDAPKNFLFRGNMPISNGTFAYESLVNTLRAVSEKNNITLPRNFSILDVRYVQCNYDIGDLKY